MKTEPQPSELAIRIEPLSSDEGGGFLVTVPDLPGCMADGETVGQAIAEAHDAFKAWAMAEREDKGDLPVDVRELDEVQELH